MNARELTAGCTGAAEGVMAGDILHFTVGQNLEFPAQQDKREFWLLCVDGHPPGRQQRILLEARAAGILSSQDTQAFLNACGLVAA